MIVIVSGHFYIIFLAWGPDTSWMSCIWMSRILMSQLRVGADLRFFFDIGKVFKNALTYLVFLPHPQTKASLQSLGRVAGMSIS